jgi:flagellin-like hook-associated protein FlgL
MSSLGPLRSSVGIREIIAMRGELDRLQLQLATGRRAESFADLGGGRSPSLNARAKLADISAYGQTIDQLEVRLSVIQASLGRIDKIAGEQRGENLSTHFLPVDNSQTAQQKAAFQRLQEMIGLLNQDVDGRKLFSGRRTDTDATVSADILLNGSPPRAGLRDVIVERNRADRGVDGLGRLAITTPTATMVTLDETASGPFGFKITGAGGTIDNATITDAIGPPRSVAVDFTGVPSAGSTVRVTLAMPDGTSTTLSLRATAGTPGSSEFALGTDATTTATNFRTALQTEVQRLVTGELVPASTMVAADGFFTVDDTTFPRRVLGVPETATGFDPGDTRLTTVVWYTADGGADPARATSVTRIDTSVTVGYGLRANEQGIRSVIANLAAFAAVDFNPTDPNVQLSYASLSLKVRDRLGDKSGQTVTAIQSEMVVVQQSLKSAEERHTASRSLLGNLLEDVEGVSKEEVATRILELQTRLQASYQTTAMLSRMSLVEFLR